MEKVQIMKIAEDSMHIEMSSLNVSKETAIENFTKIELLVENINVIQKRLKALEEANDTILQNMGCSTLKEANQVSNHMMLLSQFLQYYYMEIDTVDNSLRLLLHNLDHNNTYSQQLIEMKSSFSTVHNLSTKQIERVIVNELKDEQLAVEVKNSGLNGEIIDRTLNLNDRDGDEVLESLGVKSLAQKRQWRSAFEKMKDEMANQYLKKVYFMI